MKNLWNPVFSINVQEQEILIEINLADWHHLGVRLTAEGNLLHVHRSPLDGPHDEVILECPPEYDTYAATGESKAGSFLIRLPLDHKRVREKRQAEWLGHQLKRAIFQLEESPELLSPSLGDHSRN